LGKKCPAKDGFSPWKNKDSHEGPGFLGLKIWHTHCYGRQWVFQGQAPGVGKARREVISRMFSQLYVAASGMIARQHQLDVLANNLANVNTVGFKMEEVAFEEPGSSIDGSYGAKGQVRVSVRRTDLSPGEVAFTGEPLDLAIGGRGFLVIGDNEGMKLTRDGRLSLDKDGRLVLGGMPVMGEQGEIVLGSPAWVSISQEGQVTTDRGVMGRLRVVKVQDTSQLEKQGNGLFRVPEGTEVQDDPDPRIMSGYVELSNCSVIKCMVQMIEVIRSFEMQQKMVQTMDRLGERAVQEMSRTA
jgi:flagellar basal-body rod protein FlgG